MTRPTGLGRGTAARPVVAVACVLALSIGTASAQAQHEGPSTVHHGSTEAMAHGPSGAAVSFAELQATVDALRRARAATEKYLDVRIAEADGFRPIGPYVPGMGIHYVNPRVAPVFDVERPPILLYERDAAAGLRLAGVSYMVAASAGVDGQPAESPFPRALAVWHRHHDVCLLRGGEVRMPSDARACAESGGRFIAETHWMVHAWIWTDSPAGVFSQTNPEVR